MIEQSELFEYKRERYPEVPGFKREGTSRDAAREIKPRSRHLQSLVLKALTETNRTADEIAGRLNESILAIRPRVSELVTSGKVVDSGLRRKNLTSGKSAIVWKLVTL